MKLVLITLLFPLLVSAATNSLHAVVSPANCRGGEACDTQPTVSVLNSFGQISFFFEGNVYVQLESSPTGFEDLYLGEACTLSSCGQLITGTLASVPFVDGIATFKDLLIPTSGSGYVLKFFGRDADGQLFSSTLSDAFDVSVGSAYKLLITQPVGNAFGGLPFFSSPVVAIADRGGNVVSTVPDDTEVQVSLSASPTGSEKLLPSSALIVGTQSGLATFSGLLINEAGKPYKLTFATSYLDLLPLETPEFTVAVGPPGQLTFAPGTEPSVSFAKRAGEYFPVPPRIELRDKGGNLVWQDSSSAVRVSISFNPTGATVLGGEVGDIGPAAPPVSLFPVAKNGTVTFNSIKINKKGGDYRLLFTLFSYSTLTNEYSDTGVSILSEKFDVDFGPARKLAIAVPAGSAWAGGSQYIAGQPVVQVLDFGGNVLTSDFNSTVTASMVASPSTEKDVIVNTTDAPTTSVLSVTTNLENGTYGAGQILEMYVNFAARVWLRSVGDAPFLVTNIASPLSVSANGSNSSTALAVLVGDVEATRTLIMRYVIQANDSTPIGEGLNFLGPDAFQLPNSSFLVDGNGRQVNTTLPELGLLVENGSVLIDTSAPVVLDVRTSTADGEYGAGEQVLIEVQYNYPVIVVGAPFLSLNAINNRSETVATAQYVGSSTDRRLLYFEYLVEIGDYSPADLTLSSERILFPSNYTCNETTYYYVKRSESQNTSTIAVYNSTSDTTFFIHLNTSTNSSLLANFSSNSCFLQLTRLPFRSVSSFWTLGHILRDSDTPTTPADYNLYSAGNIERFHEKHHIIIDTTPPAINVSFGLQSTSHFSPGILYAGERITLAVQFDKPVAVFGSGIVLRLEIAAADGAPNFESKAVVYGENALLPDARTLEFVYIVQNNVNATHITVRDGSALEITGKDAFIKRVATNPSIDANLSTTALLNSGNKLTLRLDGRSPTVLYTRINRTIGASASDLYPDDSIFIEVKFSAPVVSTCAPVLVLFASYMREARYISGNMTDRFLFQYVISMGDSSEGVFYRHTPNALCTAASGCPFPTQCKMLAMSSHPQIPADLQLYRPSNYSLYRGVKIGAQIIHPRSPLRNTSIETIAVRQAAGEYTVGSVFDFDVTFTDVVRVNVGDSGAELPSVFLSFGKFASYAGGSNTKVLRFSYVAQSNDTIAPNAVGAKFLEPKNISESIGTALLCNNSCSIVNLVGIRVDLDLSRAQIVPSNITFSLDPPAVTTVWSDKKSSPYDGIYSIGERIDIFVQVSKPVVVCGFEPRIELNISKIASTALPSPLALSLNRRFAVYDRSMTEELFPSGDVLVFSYLVQPGDFAENLTYLASNPFIDLADNFSAIYRASTIPQLVMMLELPTPPAPLAINSQTIRIDTGQVPRVVAVESMSPPGRYTVGDVILLRVEFSLYVIAEGNSYITLHGGEHIRRARYIGYLDERLTNSSVTSNITSPIKNAGSAPTKYLFYEYTVFENDISASLDYTDCFALLVGLSDVLDPGYIRHAASHVRLDAILDLPAPGEIGSLSAGSVMLQIDGRPAYIVSIRFLNESGTYGTNETLLLGVQFSAPVYVVGRPYIKLETGLVDGLAIFHSGSGTSILLFAFSPEPGDYSFDLDYHTQRAEFGSAASSLVLDGGAILSLAAEPSLPALLHLNPPMSVLSGSVSQTAVFGTYTYTDLSISRRGPNFQLRFTSLVDYRDASGAGEGNLAFPMALTAVQPLAVNFASEYQIRPREALKGHRIGTSVAIEGDIAILGAPSTNRSVTTIQAVSTGAASGAPQREVQVIQTLIKPQPAIQRFHSTAAVGATVGGSFSVSHDLFGPTQQIPANADEAMIEAIFGFDLASVGRVVVTREPYIFCACGNAFTWTLTFVDITKGMFSPLILDASMLTGESASLVGAEVIQSPALLSGTFLLQGLNLVSSPIPIDATVQQIKDAVAELGLSAFDILISSTDKTLARTWTIIFDDYLLSYEMPPLSVDGSALTGGSTDVWINTVQPGRHGPLGIAGTFQLEWRGNITTHLAANATAQDVKNALEEMPVIHFVNVNRSSPSSINGYTWTIELVAVTENTPRGYFPQSTRNLEPIRGISHLIATNSTIDTEARWAFGEPIKSYDIARQGTYGEEAGAVYVYQRSNESWNQVATVVGNDTEAYNMFGGSVALAGELVLVGAVGANMNGVPEKQAVRCLASGGYFRLSFRGWTTENISFNVSRVELIDAIISSPETFANLYTINSINIDDWGSGGLCDNNTAVITFYSPIDGAAHLFGEDTGADLELLTLDNVDLTLDSGVAELEIMEKQQGTWRLHGLDADKQQIGSAYLFRAHYTCKTYSPHCLRQNWVQEAQFFPTVFSTGSRFGDAVALTETVALVGAPGADKEKGQAYVFEFSSYANSWRVLQVLNNPTLEEGSNFGAAVTVFADTLVVGAPRTGDGQGSLHVFKRPATGGTYVFAQTIVPRESLFPLAAGDLYGSSVSLYDNLLVVGAPGYDDPEAVHVGRVGLGNTARDTGAVFVFSRISVAFQFQFLEKLDPSNIKSLDAFGYTVDVERSSIVATSLQDFAGDLSPAKAVIEVKTQATYNRVPIGGTFRLQWLTTSQTDNNATFTTRSIPHDATAPLLKQILEEDLPTGPLLVSRSRRDEYDGGYAWNVTFIGIDRQVNLFAVDGVLLTGTNARVSISFIHSSPIELRGKAHYFHRSSTSSPFVEQALLSPFSHQPQDRCGQSIAISDGYVLVGCPNRDQAVPEQNSGAGFVYDTTLLGLDFTSRSFPVIEGDSVSVSVDHFISFEAATRELDAYFYITTIDRNAGFELQTFLRNLYGIQTSSLSFSETMVDHWRLGGKAIARGQFYGSSMNESRWVDGIYDYRAISDYLSVDSPLALLVEQDEVTQIVVTSPDTILEKPDETCTIVVSSPGLWPGAYSRLISEVNILDNSDGYVRQSQFAKLYDSKGAEDSAQFGAAIAMHEALGVMFIASPLSTVSGRSLAGKVLFFRNIDGNWTQQLFVFSTPDPDLKGTLFGDAVVVSQVYERNTSILAIGEPSINSVHIYISTGDSLGTVYTYETSLSVPMATEQRHRYGEHGSLALDGYLLVVGAPGLEAVYVYRRLYSTGSSGWVWSEAELVRSLDYDFDIVYGVPRAHRQEFGKAVGASGRTIIIGAPFADYEKIASNLVEEDWVTEGLFIQSTSKGRAYIFYSTPVVQRITLFTSHIPISGDFRLQLNWQGINQTSDQLPFRASAEEVKAALERLGNIDVVSVNASLVEGMASENNRAETDVYEFRWMVSFDSEWQDPPALVPLWAEGGCDDCSPFSHFAFNFTARMDVAILNASIGNFAQINSFSAGDKRSGDKFGWSVDIDGDQAVVGSPHSSSTTTTSWDFEAGILLGWSRIGDAFDFQPTFGDNSLYRSAYSQITTTNPAVGSRSLGTANGAASGESSAPRGRYYIGTYERRPGSADDFTVPDPAFPAGSRQGDEPKGSLTSDVFIIRGNQINFLIGGGCDVYKVYLELLVDGMSVAKTTGKCSEKMSPQSFDVAPLKGRAAQIRIVDDSSGNWGHINIDQIEFDWDIYGSSIKGLRNGKTGQGGLVETFRSGAVYAFRRHNAELGLAFPCISSSAKERECTWTLEAKFTASDKRSHAEFGTAVAVSDSAGVIAVGSPFASLTGTFRDQPSVYPFVNTTTGVSNAQGLLFPVRAENMLLFTSLPHFSSERSGSYGVWYLQEQQEFTPDGRAYENAGAVYVYVKNHATVSYTGQLSVPQYWQTLESAKIQPPDEFAMDAFGSTFAFSKSSLSLAVGATGQDGIANDAGAAYFYRLGFASLKFSKVEYLVQEGVDRFATVTLLRDLKVFSGELVVEYATSDLTARGVDHIKFAACQEISPGDRAPAGCGDYEQTTGFLTIFDGEPRGGFKVYLTDDECYERYMKFIKITISVPGSGVLQSEILSAKIRIDDDDFGTLRC